MSDLKGHCLCGETRWEAEGPMLWACHCHCADCRRQCAAPVVTFLGVAEAGFRWVGRTPGAYASSPGVTRHFCSRCGTPMAFKAERYAGEIHLYAAGLEHPEGFTPRFHVHHAEKLPWIALDDDLPRYEGFAPADAPEIVDAG